MAAERPIKTPLEAAQTALIELAAVESQFKSDKSDKKEQTAKTSAAGIFRDLIRYLQDFNQVNIPQEDIQQLLILAARYGYMRGVQDFGAKLKGIEGGLDARDNEHRTALHRAVNAGHFAVVQHLVTAGADVHLPYTTGSTILHRAIEFASTARTEAQKAQYNAIGIWLVENTDVNLEAENREKETPFMRAVRQQNIVVANALFERGANLPDKLWVQQNTQWLMDNVPGFKTLIELDTLLTQAILAQDSAKAVDLVATGAAEPPRQGWESSFANLNRMQLAILGKVRRQYAAMQQAQPADAAEAKADDGGHAAPVSKKQAYNQLFAEIQNNQPEKLIQLLQGDAALDEKVNLIAAMRSRALQIPDEAARQQMLNQISVEYLPIVLKQAIQASDIDTLLSLLAKLDVSQASQAAAVFNTLFETAKTLRDDNSQKYEILKTLIEWRIQKVLIPAVRENASEVCLSELSKKMPVDWGGLQSYCTHMDALLAEVKESKDDDIKTAFLTTDYFFHFLNWNATNWFTHLKSLNLQSPEAEKENKDAQDPKKTAKGTTYPWHPNDNLSCSTPEYRLFVALENLIARGHTKTLEALLANDRLRVDQKVLNALFIKAAKYGQVACMQVLQAKGADINATDWQGRTALIRAAHSPADSGLPAVQYLLAQNDIAVNEKYALGSTALHRAAAAGNTWVVRHGLAAHDSIDINAVDASRRTPLMRAIDNEHLQTALALFSSQKEITLPTGNEQSAWRKKLAPTQKAILFTVVFKDLLQKTPADQKADPEAAEDANEAKQNSHADPAMQKINAICAESPDIHQFFQENSLSPPQAQFYPLDSNDNPQPPPPAPIAIALSASTRLVAEQAFEMVYPELAVAKKPAAVAKPVQVAASEGGGSGGVWSSWFGKKQQPQQPKLQHGSVNDDQSGNNKVQIVASAANGNAVEWEDASADGGHAVELQPVGEPAAPPAKT